jgi:pimeloyl-ACP methyl ester carboxylesterase
MGTNSSQRPVTLVTTKHQEVFTFVRPTYYGDPKIPPLDDRITYPDLPKDYNGEGFYRPEPPALLRRLPELRPSVLYVFGEKSDLSPPELRKQKLDLTGTGPGGSGGTASGHVKSVLLEGCGHLVAMERVTDCADAAAKFVSDELRAWRDQKAHVAHIWGSKTQAQKVVIDDAWKEAIDRVEGKSKVGALQSRL